MNGEISMHDHHEHSHSINSRDEAAAFIKYTLHHNEHHSEELAELAHCLEHLELNDAAKEVSLCIRDFETANKRMEKILSDIES
jgi:uncharacterized protein (DUF111 family)